MNVPKNKSCYIKISNSHSWTFIDGVLIGQEKISDKTWNRIYKILSTED